MKKEILETRNENSTTSATAPLLLKESEAAIPLTTSVHNLRKWRYSGTGPAYCKLGKSVRYRMSDIIEYIEKSVVNR